MLEFVVCRSHHMKFFTTSARQRERIQWALLAVVVGGIALAIVFNAYLEYQRTTQHEQEKLAVQTEVIASNLTDQLVSANLALQGIRDDFQKWRTTPDQVRYLQTLANAMPSVRSMAVLDKNGIVLASSRAQFIGHDFSYREYFKIVKQDANPHMLYISPPFKNITGIEVIAISRMMPDAHENFGGVVIATLDIQYFKTLLTSTLYAPDMQNMLIHHNGLLFMMAPYRDDMTNKSLAFAGSAFEQHKSQGRNITILNAESDITGDKRMLVSRTITFKDISIDRPLVVTSSRNLDAIYHDWERRNLIQLCIFSVTALMGIFGLSAYQRRQRIFDQAQQRAMEALRGSEENYRVILQNTSDMIIKVGVDGRYTYVNPAFCELYATTEADLLNRHYLDGVIAEDREEVETFFNTLFHAPYSVAFTHRENTAKGIRHLEWKGRALLDDEGHVREFVGIGRDVTERVNLMHQLEDQAHRDYLTGLANRRWFSERAEIELARTQRYGSALSLLMLDIDYFKKINDMHGHKTGDVVLQSLSEVLLAALRNIDIVGRTGGEEFTVLLPETALDFALEVAERIRAKIASMRIPVADNVPIHFTVSIGISTLRNPATSLDELLDQADKALYEAKDAGRNNVKVYSGH